MSNLEKSILDSSLHDIYEDDQFEDFGKLEIVNISIPDTDDNPTLDIKLTLNSDSLTKNYRLEFSDLKDFRISPDISSYIEILDCDPRLLAFNSEVKSIYFNKPANDCYKLMSDVLEMLDDKFDSKVNVKTVFTSYSQFIYRHKINYGLYVTSAEEIVNKIMPLLVSQGMNPQIYSNANQTNKERNYKIIYLCKSWFIFDQLKVKKY